MKPLGFAPAAGVALLLVGCGGGGGGGGAAVPPPAPPPEPPAPPGPPPLAVRFTDVTAASGIGYQHAYLNPLVIDPNAFGGGVAAGDYDDDGLVDLFILRGDIGPNLLYRNLGGNRFEELAEYAGVANTKSALENHRHSGPAFADMDGDGDLDLLFGGLEFDPAFLFRNNGDGTFRDVTAGSGLDTIGSRYTVSAARSATRTAPTTSPPSTPSGSTATPSSDSPASKCPSVPSTSA